MLELREREGGWEVGIEEEKGRRKEGGVRTNLSVLWEGIRRHVQNLRFREIWNQSRPLNGQVASCAWIWVWERRWRGQELRRKDKDYTRVRGGPRILCFGGASGNTWRIQYFDKFGINFRR